MKVMKITISNNNLYQKQNQKDKGAKCYDGSYHMMQFSVVLHVLQFHIVHNTIFISKYNSISYYMKQGNFVSWYHKIHDIVVNDIYHISIL